MEQTRRWKVIILSLFVFLLSVLALGHFLLNRSLRQVNWSTLGELFQARLAEAVTFPAIPSESTKVEAQTFATYVNAYRVGQSATLVRNRESLPETSSGLTDLDSATKLDGWGHPFCLRNQDGRIAVISLGPRIAVFPGCRDIDMGLAMTQHLPSKKLYRFPSGALVLLTDRT
jgi:hypothetical protein